MATTKQLDAILAALSGITTRLNAVEAGAAKAAPTKPVGAAKAAPTKPAGAAKAGKAAPQWLDLQIGQIVEATTEGGVVIYLRRGRSGTTVSLNNPNEWLG